jgi:hypothetical protein
MNRKERRRLGQKQQQESRWMPLLPATVTRKTEADIREALPNYTRIDPTMTLDRLRALYDELSKDEVWKNDLYQVHLRRYPMLASGLPPVTHLSMRRIDRGHVFDWRHMQLIKNQLCGDECEGVELFPAESRLVDLANQRHIWVVAAADFRFPFGFDGGQPYVTGESGGGAVQRPIEETAK